MFSLVTNSTLCSSCNRMCYCDANICISVHECVNMLPCLLINDPKHVHCLCMGFLGIPALLYPYQRTYFIVELGSYSSFNYNVMWRDQPYSARQHINPCCGLLVLTILRGHSVSIIYISASINKEDCIIYTADFIHFYP